jgi:hypothetical protein
VSSSVFYCTFFIDIFAHLSSLPHSLSRGVSESPLSQAAMTSLSKQLVATAYGFFSPDILTKDFLFSAPFDGPLSKKEFLRNGEALVSYVKDLDADLFNAHVDPFEPDRLWISARFKGKGFDSAPEVMSFHFEPNGLCYRASVGYIADRTQGNGGNLGGLYGYLKSQGKTKSFLETTTVSDLVLSLKESLFPARSPASSQPLPSSSSDAASPKAVAPKPIVATNSKINPEATAQANKEAKIKTEVEKRKALALASKPKPVPAPAVAKTLPAQKASSSAAGGGGGGGGGGVAVPAKVAPAPSPAMKPKVNQEAKIQEEKVAREKAQRNATMKAEAEAKAKAKAKSSPLPAKPTSPPLINKAALTKTANANATSKSPLAGSKNSSPTYLTPNLASIIMKKTSNARAPELIERALDRVLNGKATSETFCREVSSAMGSKDAAAAVLPDIIGSLPRGEIKSSIFTYFQQVF